MRTSIFRDTHATARYWYLIGSMFCTVVVTLLSTTTVRAHEIGTTRVSIFFQKGETYNVEIVTDATALVEKLAASTDGSSSVDTCPACLQSALTSFDTQFRQRVKLAFDTQDVRPEISYAVVPGVDATSPAVATIRLTGQTPSNARLITWNYAWTFASYALTVQGVTSEHPTTTWLEGGQTSTPFTIIAPTPPVDRLATVWRYFTLGFTHIVPLGLDHMLFVFGIYLLSGRARSVLWQVSAFTVAHSITLGLSISGVVTVSPQIVEPLIALSIVYVAIENIFLSELKAWRVVLVFAFGLLHGMGFAGVLTELGLPRAEFVTALLAFNVGVEAGQLTVIGTAFLLVGWHYANRIWYRSRIVVPLSMLIACTAMYWTIQRLSF